MKFNLDPAMGDAFRIQADEQECRVGGGRNGLLYARDLAEELQRAYGGIPCAEYSDRPEILFRCYHLDLKKGSGGVEDIKRTLRRLRALRFNYVLIEYENRIRLDSLPGAATPDAFTHDEVREIVRCAEENGIQVIPLLQSFGHLEYLLTLPEYRQYSESQTVFSQLCPMNEAAFELWKKVFDEVHALHPNSEYFHIGGDETRQLGKCPVCAEYVKKHSAEDLFSHHINRVCAYAAGHNCRPMLWHDMLARSGRLDLIRKLPKKTVIIYWDYNSEEQSGTYLHIGGDGTAISRKWIGQVKRPSDFAFLPRYFSCFLEDQSADFQEKCFRRWGKYPEYPLRLPPLQMLEDLRETGLQTIGASVLFPSISNGLIGDPHRTESNIRLWLKNKAEGVIATRWAGNSSLDNARGPLSLRDYSLFQAGELLWNGKLSQEELESRYDRSFGPEAAGLTRCLYLMAVSDQEAFFNWADQMEKDFSALENKISPECSCLYRKYRIAMKAEQVLRRIHSFIRNQTGQMVQNTEYCQTLQEMISSVKQDLRENFADEFPPDSLEQWLMRLFEPYDAMLIGLETLSRQKTEKARKNETFFTGIDETAENS